MGNDTMPDQTTNMAIQSLLSQPLPYDPGTTPEFSQYIAYILKEKSIPEDVKAMFWAFSDIENAVTNVDEKDIKRLENYLEIVYSFYIMGRPPHHFTIGDELMFWQMKHKLHLKLRRSYEGFERKMQATQIRELSTLQQGARQGAAGGLIGRLRNMFGR